MGYSNLRYSDWEPSVPRLESQADVAFSENI